MANGTAVQGGTGRNSTKVIIVVGSVVLVALVGVIIALVMVVLNIGERERIVYVENEDEPVQRTRVVNEENLDEIVEEIQQPSTPVGFYEVSMNTNWDFPDGASPSSNAFVENIEANTNDVYFDVQLRDTEEVIYESPLIPRGAQLTDIQLSRVLAPGRYDCVIIYHLVDDRQETISTLSLGMTVTIEG